MGTSVPSAAEGQASESGSSPEARTSLPDAAAPARLKSGSSITREGCC